MTFKISFVSKSNKICLYLNCESVCVCSVLVKMGLSLSLLRVDFSLYRAQAKTLKVSSSEMEMLEQKFKDLLGSSLEKLKKLYSEVFSKVNWGRLVVFLNFADQLELTEEEWELLFNFLVPTLTQIRE